MNGEENMLHVDTLVKKYGEKVAVNGISLDIPKGQFFGFLGPNGAGKSTTIHCITGVSKITSGTILVGGTDVEKEYRDARRKIGISPQEFNTDFFGKVCDILDFMAGYYGLRKAERTQRIEELLERFELVEHREKKFNELSGGLKRRLILARALVHDPEFIILDEPTAGVDVEQRHALWKYFRELNAAGKTILLTSHYLEEVEMLCDRVVIINRGQIVADIPKERFGADDGRLETQYLKITKGDTY